MQADMAMIEHSRPVHTQSGCTAILAQNNTLDLGTSYSRRGAPFPEHVAFQVVGREFEAFEHNNQQEYAGLGTDVA